MAAHGITDAAVRGAMLADLACELTGQERLAALRNAIESTRSAKSAGITHAEALIQLIPRLSPAALADALGQVWVISDGATRGDVVVELALELLGMLKFEECMKVALAVEGASADRPRAGCPRRPNGHARKMDECIPKRSIA